MASTVILKATGLSLSPNDLDGADGGLNEASNVIIRRDNVIEPRRGFKLFGESFGSTTDRVKQLFVYRNRILRHYNSVLQFQNGVNNDESINFDNFDGSYSETQTGLRMKSIESNGNLYFTSSEGIKKISAASGDELSTDASYITQSGGVKALDVVTNLDVTLGGQSGFLPQDSTVAYRVVWGIRDANNNLVLGSPSQRSEVFNPLLSLLLRDFSNTLGALDDINQSTSLITDGNYVSLLNLSSSGAAEDLHANLAALATKIDTDILYANDSGTGAPLNISDVQGTATSTQVQVTVSAGTVTDYLSIGSKIFLTGFGAGGTSSTSINGARVVTTVSASTFTFNVTGVVDADTFTHTSGTVNSNEYRSITQPAAPVTPATDAELVALQEQLDAIQLRLQTENSNVIPSALATAFIDPLDITTTTNVRLDVTIPQDVTANHFIQIYRSGTAQATETTVLGDLSANDEMQLVYEAFPTSAELSAKSMIIIDITPDAFKGANLYTNEATGEGIAAANDLPPFAKDINQFKNAIFYANTKTRHKKLLSLLGISDMTDQYNPTTGALTGVTPKLMITNGTTTTTYKFVTGIKEVTPITCAADTAANTNGKYFTLNSADDLRLYDIYYHVIGSTDTPPNRDGRINLRVEIISGETAINVAIKTKNTINRNIADFTATDDGAGVLTVTNVDFGYTTAATNGTLDGSGGAPTFTIGSITQGRGESVSNKEILLYDLDSPSQAVDLTARSMVRIINKTSTETVYAYYLSGSLSIPGQMLLESRSLTDLPFYLLANNAATGESFNPDISPNTITITAASVANPSVITTSAPHGLVNGDSVIITNSTTTPSIDGKYAITYVGASTFSIPVNVTVTGTAAFLKVSESEFSENDNKPNRVYYSKIQQPEAVPIVNYFDVGAQDKAILRIFPLRDSLFVFKEDGLYRISGETSPFVLSLFDSSCILLAPDSVSVANNVVYGWTTQGISVISESGVNIISRPIDTQLLKLASSSYTNFKTATWGVGYDSDNCYIVWTIDSTADTKATIAYRYSNLTNSWTTFDKTNTCGLVHPTEDKLYLGAGDTNFIEQERKDFTRYDYADREVSSTLTANNHFGTVLKLNSVTNIEIGDVIVQEQQLTIYEFNMLLRKLDIDPGVGDTDYYSTLVAVNGDDLRAKIVALAAKLDADTGVTLTTYGSSIESKSGTITGISVADSTIITTSTDHELLTGRKIIITGSDSLPTINGTHNVTVVSPTTFSIPVAVTTTGTTGTFITSNTHFDDIVTCYNKIITLLNTDLTVSFGNYDESETTAVQEAVILDVNTNTRQVTLNIDLPYVVGGLTIYKAILSTFTYSPNTLGDPLSLKQAREATMMFENKAFTNATMSFATDLLPVFNDVDFDGDGNGAFGLATFGTGFFGGGSSSAPFRTYIPRNCQRCRFLLVKFTHYVARENYSIFGTTVTAEVGQSTRAYR